MTATATHSLRVSRKIRATPERLFTAWTDPKQLPHWWRMDAEGSAFVSAAIDLKVGGRYRLGMTTPDGNVHMAVGEYREIKRPTRLVFTWNWEEPEANVGDTLVTIEFNDAGGGATEVVLTHERFPSAETAAGHEKGWTQLLLLLERAMA